MVDELIPLVDVVQALRADVARAMEAGAGESLKFGVASIDLQFSVAVTKEGGANGQISFSVLGFSTKSSIDGKYSQERIQRITLRLTPKYRDPVKHWTTLVELRNEPDKGQAPFGTTVEHGHPI